MENNQLEFEKGGVTYSIESAYAVLMTVKVQDGKPYILLPQRQDGAWEVGFGGGPEPDDETADDTALREMCEELGQAISTEGWQSNAIRLFVGAKDRKNRRDGWFWIRVFWVPYEEMAAIIANFTPNGEVQAIQLAGQPTLADDRTGIVPMQFNQFLPFITAQMVMMAARS